MVFYTNFLIPARFAAITYGFVVLIRPEYRGDSGLLAHEQTHVRQFKRMFGLRGLIGLFNEEVRLNLEVEAYRDQLKYSLYPDMTRALYASFLATKYGFNITQEQALVLLNKGI